MSKSLGNVFTLEELFKQFNPMVLRFYFLNHHYRGPIEFSFSNLAGVQKSYQRLCNLFSQHVCKNEISREVDLPIFKRMYTFLCDDLNTAGMIGVLFDHISELRENEKELCAAKRLLTDVLGLTLEPLLEKSVHITPEIQRLIDERSQAREQKNWAHADLLREQLRQLGVEIQDEKIE